LDFEEVANVQAAGSINKEDTNLNTTQFDLLFGVSSGEGVNRWQQPAQEAAGADENERGASSSDSSDEELE